MDMSPEKLADAYRLMKTIREFEERMRSEYQQGKLPGQLTLLVFGAHTLFKLADRFHQPIGVGQLFR